MVVRQMVVDAVLLEGRSVRDVARSFGVSKTFVAKLVKRFQQGGAEALEPRSRAHHRDPGKTDVHLEDLIVALRKELTEFGVDAGAQTIRDHLVRELSEVPTARTIHRVLVRRGFVTPEPRKRPRSSFVRFEADQPNERWQSDVTHWTLANGRDVEILTFIDDHSRMILASEVQFVTKGTHVVSVFLKACENWGTPASVLTDNGAVYNAISRQGKTAFESLLDDLGVTYQHSRPYHPQTQGKIERWHRTLKQWLDSRAPAPSVPALQRQLDEFVTYYNEVRPHRARGGLTPAAAYAGRERARPGSPRRRPHYRVRHDIVDPRGKVSLRHRSKMLHINVGYRHRGRRVILHVVDNEVRVLTEDFKLLGEATLNPAQSYQPMRRVI
jgi:transposase InsO family protein